MAAMQAHWDIFCRVIDNFGDIGVCWRLARQLAAEHGLQVRLWVDDLASLAPLQPGIATDRVAQMAEGVEIRHWPDAFPDVRPADVVIEAFACELPAGYLQAMAARQPAPGWINLEYLSAEPWVESCHGVASPHPSLPLLKYFFFPGFSDKTGGLLRETGLLTERDAYLAALAPAEHLEISLFCYDTAPVGELLDTWAGGERKIRCHVPPGKPLAAVRAHLGGEGPWHLGNLQVLAIPFLPQPEYDRLLWRCDINFVRGEDSFVRAQWAGKPFVWQIYPQDDSAHLTKLDAFIDGYVNGLNTSSSAALRRLFHAWNHGGGIGDSWRDFLAQEARLRAHARGWAEHLSKQQNLAASLVKFCAIRL